MTKRDTQIPRRPLLWLAAALVFTLPPFVEGLAAWVPLVLLATIAAKFWMEPRGYRLRFLPLKLLLLACVFVAIFVTYSGVRGLEPGVSLIIVLMAVKILEAHTPREFQFMALLGFVLCLCGFFLAQDLASSASLLVAFTLLLAAINEFHRRTLTGQVWPPLRSSLLLFAQAVPLIVLLFLFFPRVATGFRFLAPSRAAEAGFSDHLSPGTVSSLAHSNAVAFRVEFPDGKIPPRSALYWRGIVMWQGGGLEWQAPGSPARSPRAMQNVATQDSFRQWITLEPHDGHWMFALDRPGNAPSGSILAPGNYLWSWQTITKPRRYEVTSIPHLRQQELSPREMLAVPSTISASVRELANSWAAENAQPSAIVARGLEFFRTQGFRYSLTPGEYNTNDLDQFLFRRRLGFCEHYAGSFATLMRLAGVPARVVVGYLGGEWNAMGRFFVVRQSDTHAWCEVWLPDRGWTRVDPTSVVAPDRINLGMADFLDHSAQSTGDTRTFTRSLARQPVIANIRTAWQTLNYAWEAHVLSFDADAQQSLIGDIGFPGATPLVLLLASAALALMTAAALLASMHFRARPRGDVVKTLYAQFCRKAAQLGVAHQPDEGPVDFSDRAARLLPNESDRIRRISSHYIQLRYAPAGASDARQQLAREVALFGE